MKILKQLIVTNCKLIFQIEAVYHHVDDPSFQTRTGYSTDIIDESISLDEVVRWAEPKAYAEGVPFTNLFTGKAHVPCEPGGRITLSEIYAGWDSEGKI